MHRDQCGEYCICICILLSVCEGLTQRQKHQNGKKKASLTATFRRAPSSKCQSSITDLQSCMIFKQGWMFLSTELQNILRIPYSKNTTSYKCWCSGVQLSISCKISKLALSLRLSSSPCPYKHLCMYMSIENCEGGL